VTGDGAARDVAGWRGQRRLRRRSVGSGEAGEWTASPPESRRISGRTATLLVVASMVGTGVFTTTGFLVRDLGSPVAVLLAWTLGGALALSGALSYAELVAALPRNGGEYHLLGRIYHPALGFAAGLVSLVVGFAAPVAASALAFGHYAAAVVPGVDPRAAGIAVIGGTALLHARRLEAGARYHRAVTSVQIALIAGFVLAGALAGDVAHLAHAARPAAEAVASPAFAVSLVYVSFAYSGWNGAAYVAGEVARAPRALPRSLVLGTAIVIASYLGLNGVFLAAAPAAQLSGVVEIGHVAAEKLLGPSAARAVSALIALVLASSVSAMTVTGPRVSQALGTDHPRLRLLARRSRTGEPALAIALQTALAIAMILTSSFSALIEYVGFTLSITAGLTVLGVVVLRWREPHLPRPYRTWGYPVTPLAFVALSTWITVQALAERPAASWAGLATILAALLLYAALARSRSATTGPVS
jgi:basic amino acid/polyamine antiporter, APA family